MKFDSSSTYVLVVPNKAEWWKLNGSKLLEDKRSSPARKRVHDHNSDSLIVLVEEHETEKLDKCSNFKRWLLNFQAKLGRSRKAMLVYENQHAYSLVSFDIECLSEQCFRNYFRDFKPFYQIDSRSDITESPPAVRALENILWMVHVDVCAFFKEEILGKPRATIGSRQRKYCLDTGGPSRAENDLDLFDDDDDNPEVAIEQVPTKIESGKESPLTKSGDQNVLEESLQEPYIRNELSRGKKREAEEMVPNIRLLGKIDIEIQESKRRVNDRWPPVNRRGLN